MNNRLLVDALWSLCGVTVRQIAEATGVQLTRLRAATADEPFKGGDQEPFESYAMWLLRHAHAKASKQLLAPPKLRSHPDLRRRIQDLDEAYRAAFGVAITQDCGASE